MPTKVPTPARKNVETIKGLVKLNFTKLTQNLNLSQQEADNAYNQAMATA